MCFIFSRTSIWKIVQLHFSNVFLLKIPCPGVQILVTLYLHRHSLHIYIIGHYKLSLGFRSSFIILPMLYELLLYWSEWTYSLKSTTNFFYPYRYWQKSTAWKPSKEIFFLIYFCWKYLTWDLNTGFMFLKTTHYLLQHDNFIH